MIAHPATVTTAARLWQRDGAQVDGDGVRFGLGAPRAPAVAVIGAFNDWDPCGARLERDDGGVWHGKLSNVMLIPGGPV